jgi:hypothetical protein
MSNTEQPPPPPMPEIEKRSDIDRSRPGWIPQAELADGDDYGQMDGGQWLDPDTSEPAQFYVPEIPPGLGRPWSRRELRAFRDGNLPMLPIYDPETRRTTGARCTSCASSAAPTTTAEAASSRGRARATRPHAPSCWSAPTLLRATWTLSTCRPCSVAGRQGSRGGDRAGSPRAHGARPDEGSAHGGPARCQPAEGRPGARPSGPEVRTGRGAVAPARSARRAGTGGAGVAPAATERGGA